MKFANFEYASPATPQEAVALLASRPGEAKLIAGGQSLLPTMAFRLAQPALLVDVRKLHDLRRIDADASGVRLGARVRWRDIEDSAELSRAHPLLAEAIRHVAHYQVRNRGTVGGSVAHADPAAEMPCIAATCGATMRVLGPAGERRIAADDFFLGPLTTALEEDELILEVTLPPWRTGRRWAFLEFARRAGDFALGGVALFYDVDADGRARDVHVGVVGACQRSSRMPRTEAALEGRRVDAAGIAAAVAALAAEADPPDDPHASAEYRRALLGTLLSRALNEAVERKD